MAVLFVLSIISVLDRNIVTLLVGPIKVHFGATDVQMGLLIGAAFALPYGLLGLPVGWLVDRYPRRAIIAAGVAIWGLGTIGTGLAGSFAGIFFARACVGSGEAALAPSQASLLGDLFPRERLGLALSVSNMGYKAGQGMALLLGGALLLWLAPAEEVAVPLVGTLSGWQTIFLVVGLPGLLFIPFVFLIPEPARMNPPPQRTEAGTGFRGYFSFVMKRRRFFVAHHLGFLLLISVSYAVAGWTPAFLIRVHGWPEDVAGVWLGTALLIAPLIGMPLHGALADLLLRRGWSDIHMRYPIFSAIGGAPFAVAAFLAPSPELAVVLVGIFVFILSGYISLPIAAVVGMLPSSLTGKGASIVMLVCSTGGAVLGPLIVATITERIFGNPMMVGQAIIATIVAILPVVVALFAATLGPLRDAARQADAASGRQSQAIRGGGGDNAQQS